MSALEFVGRVWLWLVSALAVVFILATLYRWVFGPPDNGSDADGGRP